jgi:LPXTG-motif cell wall-anchored protein
MKHINRPVRILSAASLSLAVFAFAAGPVSAAPTTWVDSFTFSNPGDGLTGVVPGPDDVKYPAGSYVMNSDSVNVTAYDVSFPIRTDTSTKFTPTAWGSSGVTDIGKAADIAARHDSIGTPYTDPRWEAAATGLAIWSVTNGVDPQSTGNAKFAERAEALVAGATAATEPSFALDFETNMKATAYGVAELTVVISDKSGPMPGQSVRASVDGTEFRAVSDNSGKAVLEIPKKFAGQSVRLGSTVSMPAGVFLKASTGASVVTASASPVTSGVEVGMPTVEDFNNAENNPTPPTPPTPPAPTPPTPVPAPVVPVPGDGQKNVLSDTQVPVVTAQNDAPPVAQVPVDTDSKDKAPKKDKPVPQNVPDELPKTGSDISPAWIAALTGIAALGGAGLLFSRSRENG